MKRLFILLIPFIIHAGCNRSPQTKEDVAEAEDGAYRQDTIRDIDGNIYSTFTAGNQVWMGQNLKVTRFRNGERIPEVTDPGLWRRSAIAARCNFDNDTLNAVTYGRLYNGYAATDPRNICPAGWHLPSDAEWNLLVSHTGGEMVAGRNLMENGFTALFGGYRSIRGEFFTLGSYGFYWTSSEGSEYTEWCRFIQSDWQGITDIENSKTYGFSIRCVKDNK